MMLPPPETLALLGMAGVTLFGAVKLLAAHRAGTLQPQRRPTT